jgi:hypothetical protein
MTILILYNTLLFSLGDYEYSFLGHASITKNIQRSIVARQVTLRDNGLFSNEQKQACHRCFKQKARYRAKILLYIHVIVEITGCKSVCMKIIIIAIMLCRLLDL